MPEFSLPFDSIASDLREYPAEQFVQYLKPLINTGILTDPDTLKVEAREGMTVQVQTGYAWIEGYVYSLYDVPLPITLAGAHNTLDRIDRIVLRLDLSLSARSIEVRVLQGEPAANLVPPALTREGNIYELSLAQVRVTAGQSFINAADITDERGDKELCPVVSSNILPSINDALQVVIDRVDALTSRIDNLKVEGNTPSLTDFPFPNYNASSVVYIDNRYTRDVTTISSSFERTQWTCSDSDENNVYIGDSKGYVRAFRKSDFSLIWETIPYTAGNPYIQDIMVTHNSVYVISVNTSAWTFRIYRRNLVNGGHMNSSTIDAATPKWCLGLDANGNVYVSNGSNSIRAFSNTLNLLWSATFDTSASYQVYAISRFKPGNSNNHIYFTTCTDSTTSGPNRFYKFNISDQSVVWRADNVFGSNASSGAGTSIEVIGSTGSSARIVATANGRPYNHNGEHTNKYGWLTQTGSPNLNGVVLRESDGAIVFTMPGGLDYQLSLVGDIYYHTNMASDFLRANRNATGYNNSSLNYFYQRSQSTWGTMANSRARLLRGYFDSDGHYYQLASGYFIEKFFEVPMSYNLT
ncbi:hypothetical protein [Halalkalibacter oceani]|uniref:hypothetical protein n=1 Tax=Halalkalibacter oceani TaxID=1653776 RepID=UPI003390B9C1